MELGTENNLKKVLDGLLTLEKASSGSTRTSTSIDLCNQKLEDDTEILTDDVGSISEGTLAQNLPKSHFSPGFRENNTLKVDFIKEFSNLVTTQQYGEALVSLKAHSSKMDLALIDAASSNNSSLCRQLMDKREHGNLVAECNAKNSEGNTALHIACLYGHLKVCEILLDYGDNIEINAINLNKQTPLHLACLHTHKSVAQLLLRSGAQLNQMDMKGNTPIHYAVASGSPDLIEWLLTRQPDLSIKNSEGKSAIDMNLNESIQELFTKELSSTSSSLFQGPKQADFLGMLQKLNILIQKSPRSSTDLEPPQKLTPAHFRPMRLLGKGSFGEVYLVEKKDSKRLYAMKILMKNKIMGQNLVRYAMAERNVTSCVKNPFIVSLRYSFQTDSKLYLILDYCPGGSLGGLLQREKRITEERAKVYLCEILLAFEELHKRDIIYRDLKPDNVVIDSEGHAMLTDFGLSKEGVIENNSAKSFCGSVAYLAPEMLKRIGHGKAVDWYLLGVLLYEMLIGSPPFYSHNRSEMFFNIKKGKLRVPTSLTQQCKRILQELLQKDPNKRLGSKNDAAEVKQHEFFNGVDWELVYQKGLKPAPPVFARPSAEYLPDNVIFDSVSDLGSNLPGWTFVGNTVN